MRSRPSRRARTAPVPALLVAVLAGCSAGSAASSDGFYDASGPGMDAGSHSESPDSGALDDATYAVRAIFEPAETPMKPMDFGDIPWPDDLYRDAEGAIHLAGLPGDVPDVSAEALRSALHELDGFSGVAPVFFRFDGAIDPDSLPADRHASTEPSSSVFLMDIDPSSPTAFTRVPIEAAWNEEQQRLALRPALGEPLVAGRRYAAVVTDGVLDGSGSPVGPDADFAALRDSSTAPEGAVLRRAYDEYAPVFEALAGNGLEREHVAALAVFRVQSLGTTLEDARASVRAQDPPRVAITSVVSQDTSPSLDDVLGTPETADYGLYQNGVPHGNLGWMVHGTLPSQGFLSRTAGAHGRFERNESGQLVVKRQTSVPFTLCLPRATGDAPLESLPVLIFQHGLGAERSDVLAVADALTAAGYAVLAIDAPFHGLRVVQSPSDDVSRFVLRDAPDFFGDARGREVAEVFLGVSGGAGSAGLPLQWRDAMYQGVVDLMASVFALERGDWSALEELDAELASLSFSTEHLGYVGVELGGQLGTLLLSEEPSIGGAAFVATGALDDYGVLESPKLSGLMLAPMLDALGIPAESIELDEARPRFRPEIALWQTLLERATPALHAPIVRAQPKPLLMIQTRHDEVINNLSGEALGYALGMQIAGGDARHVPMERAELPVGANVQAGNTRVTRVLYELSPATHDVLYRNQDESTLEHPVRAPFPEKPAQTVDNPVGQAIMQLSFFFESWREGAAGVSAP